MRDYCAPLRDRRVDRIDTQAVLGILRPIWTKIPDTASRVGRGRHNYAGISVIVGAENPTDCAIAATASRSRRAQVGLRSRRLRSNAWLLGVVANPSRLYGP